MRRRLALAAIAAACMPPSFAADAGQSPASTLSFNAPIVLRGTLGDEQVQMRLQPKPIAGEGLRGEYFVFGRSQKVLLAGEAEGTDLFLEESENGTDVSGHWNATVNGDTISGDWASVGGAVTKRFMLKAVPIETKTPRARHGAVRPAALPKQ